MAKHPLMFVSTDDPTKFAQMVAIAAGTVVAAAPAAPVAAAAPPPPPVAAPAPPPPVAAPAPPPPVAAPAPPPPPAPVAVAAPAAPPAPGGITVEQIVAKMSDKVSQPGKAASVSALLAQYNAKEPGKPGPIGNVDPAQYTNLLAALEAL